MLFFTPIILTAFIATSVYAPSEKNYSPDTCKNDDLQGYDEETSREASRNQLKFEDNDLKTLEEKFFCKGKPVHPLIIERFISFSISDGWKPKTISMDLIACTDTNEFYEDFNWEKSDGILQCRVERNQGPFAADYSEGAFFQYKWLGRLNNGLHVIKTYDDGGGTAWPLQHLLFFKVSKETAFTPDGKPYTQLLLTYIRGMILAGDKYTSCNITLLHDSVIVKTNDESEYVVNF